MNGIWILESVSRDQTNDGLVLTDKSLLRGPAKASQCCRCGQAIEAAQLNRSDLAYLFTGFGFLLVIATSLAYVLPG